MTCADRIATLIDDTVFPTDQRALVDKAYAIASEYLTVDYSTIQSLVLHSLKAYEL